MFRMVGGSLGVAVTGAIFQGSVGASFADASPQQFVDALGHAMSVCSVVALAGAVIGASAIRARRDPLSRRGRRGGGQPGRRGAGRARGRRCRRAGGLTSCAGADPAAALRRARPRPRGASRSTSTRWCLPPSWAGDGQSCSSASTAAICARRAAAPAAEVYTGVLYERLGLPGLPAAARRRAGKRVLIASALWGFVRPGDAIPYYRLRRRRSSTESGRSPPGGGNRCGRRCPTSRGRRSSTCAPAPTSRPGSRSGRRLLAVRAFATRAASARPSRTWPRPSGAKSPAPCCSAKAEPGTPEQVAAVARDAGFEVELGDSSLDVIVSRSPASASSAGRRSRAAAASGPEPRRVRRSSRGWTARPGSAPPARG